MKLGVSFLKLNIIIKIQGKTISFQLLNINVISFATVRHYGQLVLRFCNSLNFISAHICKLQVVEGPIKNDEDHYRWILISVLPGNYSKMPRHT